MTWNDITYRQFLDIKEALKITDETERDFAVAQAVYGEDVLDLPLAEYNKKYAELNFLQKEIPNDLHVKNIKVNGRDYYFDGLLGKITTAQYIDFQHYLKNNDEYKTFSVFIIPKGHKYNDGYDMEQVFKDILDMPVPILFSISFFFIRQLETFIKIFQHSSTRKIQKMKIKDSLKKDLNQIITSSLNLVSYRTSLNSVK